METHDGADRSEVYRLRTDCFVRGPLPKQWLASFPRDGVKSDRINVFTLRDSCHATTTLVDTEQFGVRNLQLSNRLTNEPTGIVRNPASHLLLKAIERLEELYSAALNLTVIARLKQLGKRRSNVGEHWR